MERKNMVLLTVIAVATLLVAVVGATFAYFTATVKDERTGEADKGQANITAGSVASETIVGNVDNAAGKFTATDVYPGHKEIAGLSVKVTNSAQQTGTINTKVNIVYDVTTNEFQANEIEVSVYKSNSPLELNDYFGCVHSEDPQESNEVHFTETCSKTIESLVSDLSATKLTSEAVKLKGGPQEKLVLTTDTISATGADATTTAYYYVVVEFKETQADQNKSMNAKLEGKISVEVA